VTVILWYWYSITDGHSLIRLSHHTNCDCDRPYLLSYW